MAKVFKIKKGDGIIFSINTLQNLNKGHSILDKIESVKGRTLDQSLGVRDIEGG